MILYHGSKDIIEKPVFGFGKPYNDYGLGFYMSKDIELAKEWSAQGDNKVSYVNEYEIDESKLKILDLDQLDDKVLKWITVLLKYRIFNVKFPQSELAKEFLLKKYFVDVEKYDMVRGYRADDCYFMFAKSFLNNQITLSQLGRSLQLGKLGDQYVIKSKKAFGLIKFRKYYEVDAKEYNYKRALRNQIAAKEYLDVLEEDTNMDDLFLIDIIRKEMNEDRKNKKKQ